MAKKIYKKLVRDHIPAIIKGQGHELKMRILSEEEHLEALIAKLSEELEEFKEANNIEELADLSEVLLSLAHALGIPREELEKVRAAKAAERGGFHDKIFLEHVIEREQ